MFKLLALGAILLGSAPADFSDATSRPAAEPKVLKAIDIWLRTWNKGKLDIAGRGAEKGLGDKSIARKFGTLPRGTVGKLTAYRELQLLVDQAAELDTPEATARVLAVAAAGMDGARYTAEMAPQTVRNVGEAGLAKFKNPEAIAYVNRVANGEESIKGGRGRKQAMQTAACKALGQFGDVQYRATLEQQLGAGNELVRQAAAEGLWRMAPAESADPLVRLIEREKVELVLETAVSALQEVMTRHQKSIPVPVQQHAIKATIAALGRCGWRSDMALIAFLERFRSKATIPALIAILERFIAEPDAIKSGELSGLLRYRAHETLASMTGAFFPIDRPDQWREFWEREQETFVFRPRPEEKKVAKADEQKEKKDEAGEEKIAEAGEEATEKAEAGEQAGEETKATEGEAGVAAGAGAEEKEAEAKPAAAEVEPAADAAVAAKEQEPKRSKKPDTVSTGFFGIPVQGTRVIFIVDLSGSMNFPMSRGTTAGPARYEREMPVRLDAAKKELIRAVNALPDETYFNLVSFNGNPKAKSWSKRLIPASKGNKKKFTKFVEGLRADGGTNTWSGLEEALSIKSIVYGERYPVSADEVFVLSDGIPTVGNVIDAREILNLVAETNRFSKLRINTVYIASQLTARDRQAEEMAGMSGRKFMRLMAEENGGKAIRL